MLIDDMSWLNIRICGANAPDVCIVLILFNSSIILATRNEILYNTISMNEVQTLTQSPTQGSTAVLKNVAVFGGGCFWCTEAVFKMMKGVSLVKPGYTGGTVANPTYDQVCTGKTGHAEVVYIEYDPSIVEYKTLLTVFFGSHDPTTLNKQGADIGTEYRSIIFYTTLEQKEIAEKMIQEIDSSSEFGDPVVTEVVPLETFYDAENEHQDFATNQSDSMYCYVVINPKLEKVQKRFAELLK